MNDLSNNEKIQVEPIFDPRDYADNLVFTNSTIPVAGHNLRGHAPGGIVSKVTGSGFEFDDLREYEPGEDANHIDWAATARQADGSIIVREFKEEIVPDVMIVTDTLQAVNHFTPGVFNEQALGISAVLYLINTASKQGMRAGVIASSQSGVETLRKPGSGKRHLLYSAELMAGRMLESAEQTITPESENERPRLKDLLKYAGQVCSDSLVVVVSNLLDEENPQYPRVSWKNDFDALSHRGNKVIVAQLTNRFNESAPTTTDVFSVGGQKFRLGTGKLGAEQRARYEHNAGVQQQSIAKAVAPHKRMLLSTAEPLWASSLAAQLRSKA